MSNQTIDAIKVRLGVDAADVATGVDKANKELDALGTKKRTVEIIVSPKWDSGKGAQSVASIEQRINKWKQGVPVKLDIGINETGKFSAASVRQKINEGLKAGGGVAVPIKVELSKAEISRIQTDIRHQVGVVTIDFEWEAKGPPTYDGPPIQIPWEFAKGPDGSGPSGPAAGPSSKPPSSPPPSSGGPGAAYHPGKQPGESRQQASARHKAENAADEAAKKAAREEERAAKGKDQHARKEQQAQQQAKSTGTSSTTPGSAGDATRRAQNVAETAERRAAGIKKDAAERVIRTTRQRELDEERRELLKARKEHQAQAADAATPAKKKKYERIVTQDEQDLAKNAAALKVAAQDPEAKANRQRAHEATRAREAREARQAPASPPPSSGSSAAPPPRTGPIGGRANAERFYCTDPSCPHPPFNTASGRDRHVQQKHQAKPSAGAPTSGGTATGTTGTSVPGTDNGTARMAGVPFGGATSLDSMRGGKKLKGRGSMRMSAGGRPSDFGPEGSYYEGENAQTVAAKLGQAVGPTEHLERRRTRLQSLRERAEALPAGLSGVDLMHAIQRKKGILKRIEPMEQDLARRMSQSQAGHGQRGQHERAAQARHREELLAQLDPHIGGEVWDTGELDEMLEGSQQIFSETDKAHRAALIRDFRRHHSGHAEPFETEQYKQMTGREFSLLDRKKIKRNRRISRRVHTVGATGELDFIAQALGGEASLSSLVDLSEGQSANRLAGARYSGRKGTSQNPRSGGGIRLDPERREEGVVALKPVKRASGARGTPPVKPVTAMSADEQAAFKAETRSMAQEREENARREEQERLLRRTGFAFQGNLPTDIPAAGTFSLVRGAEADRQRAALRETQQREAFFSGLPKIKQVGGKPKKGTFNLMSEKADQIRAQAIEASSQMAARSASTAAEAELTKLIKEHTNTDSVADPRFRTAIGEFRKKFGSLPIDKQLEQARGIYKPFTPVTTPVAAAVPKAPRRKKSDHDATQPKVVGKDLSGLRDLLEMDKLVEGGRMYSRPFGKAYKTHGRETREHPANANLGPWKKARAAQLRAQPYCSHCGIGRSEARDSKNPLTADHIIPVHAGGSDDPDNLLTLCRSCNSRKGGEEGHPDEMWDHARPRSISSHPKLKAKREDFLPGGRFFGVSTLRQALKKRDEGGATGIGNKDAPARLGRQYHFFLDGRRVTISGSEDQVTSTLRQLAGSGHNIRPATGESESGGPRGYGSAASHIRKRGDGGAWVKHGGLLERMAQAGHEPSITMLGERGPELAVTDPSTGQTEIVPTHKVPTWLQRAREGKGVAKDMTGRADGGAAPFGRAIRPIGGGGGTFRQRMSVASSKALDTETASQLSGVVRVAVVNFPTWMTRAAIGAPAGAASSGFRPGFVPPPNAQTPPGTPPPAPPTPNAQTPLGAAVNQAGAAAGTATTAVPSSKAPAVTPMGRAQAKMGARASVDAVRAQIGDIRGDISEAQSLSPVRALSVSVGQIFANTIGGRQGILKRARGAELKAGAAMRRTTEYENAKAALTESRQQQTQLALEMGASPKDVRAGILPATATKEQIAANEKLTKTIQSQRQARAGFRDDMLKSVDAASKASKGIIGITDAVRNLAASGVGVVAGTLAFSAAFNGVTTAIEAGTPQFKKWIDSAMGFTAENQRVTKDIGTSLRSSGGNLTTTMGQLALSSGLSGGAMGFLGETLGSSAFAKAGAEAQGEKSELFKAAASSGAPTGLIGGYGGLFGGSFLAEAMGGGKGYAEQLGLDMKDLSQKAAQRTSYIGADGRKIDQQTMNYMQMGSPNLLNMSAMAAKIPGNRSLTSQTDAMTEEQKKAAEALVAYTDDFSEAMKRGAGAAGEAAYGFEKVSDEQLQQFADISSEAADMAKSGKAMVDAQGNVVTTMKEFSKGLSQGARGNAIGTPEAWAAQQRQGLLASFAMQGEQAKYASGVSIPAQFGQQLAATPFLDAATGVLPTTGATNLGKGAMTSVSGMLSRAQAGQDLLKSQGEAAIKVQADWIKSMEAGNPALAGAAAQYTSFMDAVTASGQTIAKLQTTVANAQTNASFKAYANNMRLVNRAISDALGLAGKASGPNNLGAVERQQTMLGFGMQQREINFKMAMAGFTSVGETPEQRQANIEYAQYQANYAQKQLDLSKQGFGIQAERGVTDTSASKAVMEAEWAAQVAAAAAQKEIAVEQMKQAKALSQAANVVSQAEGTFSSKLGAAAGYVAVFGKTIGEATVYIRKALEMPAVNPQTGKPVNPNRRAPGFFGTVGTPTQMTVGEAGSETVAVLRNPRSMMLGGGGGGGGTVNVNININGGGEIDAEKLQAWGAQIQRATLAALDRKTSLLGLRQPA